MRRPKDKKKTKTARIDRRSKIRQKSRWGTHFLHNKEGIARRRAINIAANPSFASRHIQHQSAIDTVATNRLQLVRSVARGGSRTRVALKWSQPTPESVAAKARSRQPREPGVTEMCSVHADAAT